MAPPAAKRQKLPVPSSSISKAAGKGRATTSVAAVQLPLEVDDSVGDDDDDDGSSGSGSEEDSEEDSDADSDEPYVDADDLGEGPSRIRVSVSVSPPPEPSSASTVPSRVNLSSRLSSVPSRTPAPRQAAPKAKAASASSSASISAAAFVGDASDATTPAAASSKPDTFNSLGISQQLLASLGTLSIRRPTPIQSMTIPSILAKRDVIGISPTGSGKTLSFALPILQRIAADPFGIWAVVLTPTRELAFQIAEQFHVVGVPLGVRTSVVVGGMDVVQQGRELRDRPGVVVATPGRLRDLLGSSGGEWGLDRVQTLVLDEADRMLTPTFASDLAFLLERMPEERQTVLFTATESDAIRGLAAKPPRKGKDTIVVRRVESPEGHVTVANLKQHYLFIPSHVRESYLYYLLLNPPESIAHLARPSPHAKTDDPDDETPLWPPSTILFTQTCATAAHLHALLTELQLPSVALHSYLSQRERLSSLAQFRAATVPILVATDVGSRGLDIPEVAMVVNWDCPREPDAYVHRVGRTARAGRGGVAVTMVTERDVEHVERIEEGIKVELQELTLPESQVLEALNKVSTAKRVAAMALHDAGFGEKQKNRAELERRRKKRDRVKAGLE